MTAERFCAAVRVFLQDGVFVQSPPGGGAGRFAPREVPLPTNPAEARGRPVAGLADAVEELGRRVATWSEIDLDRYRLPHPLLGKLTVREMLFFTVQHLAHHASKVE